MLLISVRNKYNIQFLLLFIFLLNHLSFKCVYTLSIKCNPQLYLTGCPFRAKCNKTLGLCQCKPQYPIHLSRHSPCLNYRKLGEQCIHSSQCSKTSNAVCYDKDFGQLNETPILNKRFLEEIVKKDDDYEYGLENYGQCNCKVGYKINAKNECEKIKLKDVKCENSLQCLSSGKNVYCNRDTKKCSCNSGYTYESNLDRCVTTAKNTGLNFNTSDVYKKYSTGVELSTEYSAEDIMGILGLGLCVGSFVGCYIYCYLKCPVLYHMCSVCHEEELTWISYRTYIKQRNNKRRLTRTTQAPTHPSAPLPPPLPSPYSPPFTPLPSAPFPTRSGPIVEVDIEITNTPNLLTVTENHKNECHSPSATSLPPYDIAVMDQQLPTYEQAIACTQIQLKK